MKPARRLPTSEGFGIAFHDDSYKVPESPMSHFARFVTHHESGDFAQADERKAALERLGWSVAEHPVTGFHLVRRGQSKRGRNGK
jgi:hypothetical protein